MKTNIIASLLLGVAIACQAQSKNPAANQKPVAQLDGVGTPITDENSAMKSGATILKTEDGNAVMVDGSLKAGATFLKTADGKAFVVDPNDPAMSSGAQCFPPPPLDSSVAGVGVQLSVKDNAFIIENLLPGSAAAANKLINKGDHLLAVGEGFDQAPAILAGKKVEEAIAMIRGKAGSVVRLVVVPAGADDSAAREVALVRSALAKLLDSGPGAPPSQTSAPLAPEALRATKGDGNGDVRIIKTQDGSVLIEDVSKRDRTTAPADPAATATLQLTNAVSPALFVTRLYSLKALITKVPAEIDDDAHNKKAEAAYKVKVEALLAWAKTVLERSEPAGAAFAYSPEAGAFVLKATDSQHDAVTQGVALFEENYGK